MTSPITDQDRITLLRLAREALEHGVRGQPLPPLNPASLSPSLMEVGAAFVTLTIQGGLRGCIGALEARQSLAEDVREHAVAAALQDPRFPPVQEDELDRIHIEVSCLTPPRPLAYDSAEDLAGKLRRGVDGVILQSGYRRATFLPQVWEKLPDPAEFLGHLCLKLGAEPDLWRRGKLQVYIYQVEEFHELN